MIGDLDAEFFLHLGALLLDLVLVAEAVQHDMRASTGKRFRQLLPDAAGGAGDDGGLAF